MTTVWILVCDGAKARTFETEHGEPTWKTVDVTLHEESRSKASELVSDHSGSRSSEGGSVHHNALAAGSPPKEVEKERFAHSLAAMLDSGLRQARFDKWVLVAPAHVLGLVKKAISPALDKHLMATVDQDLGHLDIHALTERLREAVRIPPNELPTFREAIKRAH
jgi:protein required for attachment to host cells